MRIVSDDDAKMIEGKIVDFIKDDSVSIMAFEIGHIESISSNLRIPDFMDLMRDRYSPYIEILWIFDPFTNGVQLTLIKKTERKTKP